MVRYAGTAVFLVTALFTLITAGTLAQTPQRTAKEGLQDIGVLVGTWRGTGEPAGTLDERRKNFWVETFSCEWKFKGTDKGTDAWFVLGFDKSKHYKSGELRFLPEKNLYQLSLKPLEGDALVLRGELKAKSLSLETEDGSQRLVFTLLHDNRFLYRKEVRPEGKNLYAKVFQVGATKEGVAFAITSDRECIVTGGLGTMTVSYQGKTYYVCCTGCRDEFNSDPAKYVKEFESRKNKK